MTNTRIISIILFLTWAILLGYHHQESQVQPSTELELSYEQSTVMIETAQPLSPSEVQRIEKVEGVRSARLFSTADRPFFKKFYYLKTTQVNTQVVERLKSLLNIVYIEYPVKISGFSLVINPARLDPQEPQSQDEYSNYQWALSNKGQIVYEDLYEGKQVDLRGKHITDSTYDGRDDIGYQYILDRNSDSDPTNDIVLKKDVIVGVADSGVDIEHEDLQHYDEANKLNLGNLALNQQRNPENGELVEGGYNECNSKGMPIALGTDIPDTDGLGFPGDCIGWNFLAEDGERDQRFVTDKTGHGTHIAGIIAAIRDNNKGVAGFSNQIKILPMKVLKEVQLSANGRPPRGLRRDAVSDVGYLDRVSLSIDYAVKRGASVINMSFGWPAQAINIASEEGEIKSISEMMALAEENGVSIVAAVGNNNHETPIFPCAFEQVICVGSMDIDGKVSNFSNFGAHVDLVAPGQRIISIVPTALDLGVLATSRLGEYLAYIDGTSQAAPFVSGTVALLKGFYPEITNDEVRARLYLGAKKIDFRGKSMAHGLVRIDGAFEAQPQPVIRPVFKGNNYVQIKESAEGKLKAELPIKIKNFWLPQNEPLTVDVSFHNPGVSSQKTSFTINSLGQSESTILPLQLDVASVDIDSNLVISVNLGSFGTFNRKYVLANGTSQGMTEIVMPIEASEYVMKHITRVLNNPRIKAVQVPLFTIQDDKRELEKPEYYLIERTEEGQIYHILKQENGKIKEKGTFEIPGAQGEIIFVKRDIDGDGDKDYYISSVVTRDDKKFIGYSFFNNQLEPLYGEYNHFLLTHRKSNIPNIENTVFMTKRFEKGTSTRIPVFVATGFIGERKPPQHRLTPKDIEVQAERDELRKKAIRKEYQNLPQDINKDWFDGDFDGFKKRIYYYEPVLIDGEIEIHERAFSNYFLEKKLRLALAPYYNLCQDVPRLGISAPENCRHFDFNDVIDIIRILPPTEDQMARNEISVLFSVLEDSYTNCSTTHIRRCGTKYDYFTISFNGEDLEKKNFKIQKVDIPVELFNAEEGGSELESAFSKKGLNETLVIDGSHVRFKGGLSAFAIVQQDQEYINMFLSPGAKNGFEAENLFSQPNPLDRIVQHVGSFMDNGQPVSLLRTASYLYVISRQKWNDQKDPSRLSVVVSDFLPGHFYAQAIKQIVAVDDQGVTRPALFVDASDTHGSRLFTWLIKDGQLLAPSRLNLNFPETCESMNPVRMGASNDFAYALICPEGQDGAVVKYYKINNR